jgi:ferrous iron transport protein A
MLTQSFTVTGASLKLLKCGESGIVTRMKDTDDETVKKLRAIGIQPGTLITLEQRFPRFIIRVRGDRIALRNDTINAIFVRINSSSNARARKKW